MSKLHLYGVIARALHYQHYRRSMQRRLDYQKLGTVTRFWPDVYDWWHS
jgi:cytoplasmic iron level regulating protein YaaA (DUF328/UPF0246 family)